MKLLLLVTLLIGPKGPEREQRLADRTVISFATVGEAQQILGRRDAFVAATSPLDRLSGDTIRNCRMFSR